MKASEADILLIPGYKNAGPGHWQSRWEQKLSTARRVEQAEWNKPVVEDWVEKLVEAVNASTRPVVLVAHSLGIPTAILALPKFEKPVAGGFFVAPPEVDNPKIRPKHLQTFGPYPRDPLPFPSIVIASRNDSFGSFDHAGDIANAWGAAFFDVGEAGHINEEDGFGPWPEGILMFGRFLSHL
ncbi:alpha/beta hydrolase [Martelella mediterranea]|uniref:RBBP9/YdeN family alpha/beta hydrolase n=1 Tax=Martelella mediterranea TaxID=293089 RepID=UPI001E5223DA|nr:alpha/beta hydrolase [Martelella mediterranea]MCD1632855.1 alpha/beta hydrolase [Martelella mediterranea]